MILGLSYGLAEGNTVLDFNPGLPLRQGGVLTIYLGTGDEVDVELEGYAGRGSTDITPQLRPP